MGATADLKGLSSTVVPIQGRQTDTFGIRGPLNGRDCRSEGLSSTVLQVGQTDTSGPWTLEWPRLPN